jgi:ribonucleoside-diphosphate reductase alpha chain
MTSTSATTLSSFTQSQMKTFRDRYALRDPNDPTTIIEDAPPKMWRRVARWAAQKEADPTKWEGLFHEALADFQIVLGGRIMHAAGSSAQVTASNCYVLPMPQDSRKGILKLLEWWSETQARGGGVGANFSSLRPSGSVVKGVNGTSSGPLPWMELFSTMTNKVIQQGGTRRGAAMLMLSDSHPDIMQFITAKKTPGVLEGANLSVTLTDAFMEAVAEDADWELRWGGELYNTIKAKELWDMICESAWESGEPGCFWIDRYNNQRNIWYRKDQEAQCTNPCLSGDTRLATTEGLIRMDDLYRAQRELTVISDRRGEFLNAYGVSERAAVPVFMTSPAEKIFRLKTTHGYELKATSYHEFITPTGRVKLADLRDGDTLLIQSGEGAFGTEGCSDLGLVLGCLTGDGYFNGDRVCLSFWGRGRQYADVILGAVNRLIEPVPVYAQRSYGAVGLSEIVSRDEVRIRSRRLSRLLADYGVTNETKLQVPEVIWRGTRETVISYLSSLFAADGTVNVSGHLNQSGNRTSCSVRLSQSNQPLLREVQVLLANFGIESRIKLRRSAGVELLPNGRGGKALYNAKSKFELIIDGANRDRFAETIGFIDSDKQEKLESFIDQKSRSSNRSRFETQVESIEFVGVEPVYDTTEPQTHTITANGLVTAQCAEQPLPPWGVCLLGTINAAAFVRQGSFHWDDMKQVVWRGVRMLDNVIDLCYYPLPQYQQHQQNVRRIGLGVTGLADALVKQKMAYGGSASIGFIEMLYQTIAEEAYRESIRLATEKGMFPYCDPEKHSEGWLVKRLSSEISPRIRKVGIRNGYLTSQQPSGTGSLLADVNSGIEPIFDYNAIRDDRLGKYKLDGEAIRLFRQATQNNGSESPDYFVGTNDLSPEQHVEVQAAAQHWNDSAISKTVNAPEDYTVAQTKQLYVFAYDQGLRTIAFYRDGSRSTQVLYHEDRSPTETAQPRRIKLPKERDAITHRFQVGEQEGYVTVGLYEDGRPGEVFITMSKEGSTTRGLMDSFATAISIALQYGVELHYLTDKFSGAKFEPSGMTDNRDLPQASSTIDYIFRWLGQRFGSELKDGELPPVLRNGHLCPDCGSQLVHQEGCEHCEYCSYVKCG